MPSKSLTAKKQRVRKPKAQKQQSKGKRKASAPTRTPAAPPLAWPEYPTGPTTVEQMHEIDRKQKEYIAYYGTSPWSPENLWGPDEDSYPESDGSEEREETETKGEGMEAGDMYCPQSLEDGDILRAIEYALAMARQWRDDQQLPAHLQSATVMPTPSTSGVHTNEPPTQPESQHPTEIQPDRTQPSSTDAALPHTELLERQGGVKSRLRPRDKLRKTEKAKKLYRI